MKNRPLRKVGSSRGGSFVESLFLISLVAICATTALQGFGKAAAESFAKSQAALALLNTASCSGGGGTDPPGGGTRGTTHGCSQ